MAFGDFTFPQVKDDLDLTIDDADLYSDVPSVPVREELASTIAFGMKLALAVDTGKARSEFIIAPILVELRRRIGDDYSLFSGVDLNVDPSKGLNGTCDFIVSGSPHQSILSAPLITIVEAKRDYLRSALGQCIASMVAAQLFNLKAGSPIRLIHGVATTGAAWKFLRLENQTLTIDLMEYYIHDPGKILGVLLSMLDSKSE